MDVLCVDDDADILHLTVAYLERKLPDATVHTVTDSDDVLDILATEPIRCIVSDYDMPGRNGIELLETVREEYPDLPFILFTGKGSEEIASTAISAGVTDYLQKRGPEQYDRLAARIQNAVAQNQTQEALEERVKELSTIQAITELLSENDSDRQLEQVVDYLPQSVQYPEHAVARLAINGDTFTSSDYEAPVHELTVRDVTTAGTELTLTVGYTGGLEVDEADPFLTEEHELFSTILQMITAHRDREYAITELREAHRRLRLILENTTAVMYLKDCDGRYVFVNDEYERLFGLSSEEILGRTDAEIHPPAMAEEVQENDRQVLEAGDQLQLAERIEIDGAERVYLSLKVPARNDAGEIEGVFGVSTDITQRKEYERRLRAEQQFVQSIFQSLPDPLYAFDTEGNPTRWNEEFETVTGYTGAEIESMTVTDFVPEDEVETIARDFQRILDEERSLTIESAFKTKDGDEIPYEFTGAVLEGAGGNIRGVTGIGRDLSARKKRERQLEALNEAAQSLLVAESREAVAEVGVEAGRDILGLEANAIHLYDAAAEGLVPVAMTDAVLTLVGEPPTLRSGDSIAWRVHEHGDVTAIDDVHSDPDVYNPDTKIRSELYLPLGGHGVLVAGSPEPEAFGQQHVTLGRILAATIGSALDQIERESRLRAREQELARQNDRLEEFASIVSHDLRNPLGVAKGRLELAQEECDSDHLHDVERAHDRMSALIDDLLVLAREGDPVGEMESVVLAGLVSDCWETVETADATLLVETVRTVLADESRLRQLLENLIRNAIEHGGEDVTITVGDLADGFYIADDGPGIPAGERDEVFDAGYSTSSEGTGFGLSIVEQIADAHDWDIAVTESDSGGAKFEITGVSVAD